MAFPDRIVMNGLPKEAASPDQSHHETEPTPNEIAVIREDLTNHSRKRPPELRLWSHNDPEAIPEDDASQSSTQPNTPSRYEGLKLPHDIPPDSAPLPSPDSGHTSLNPSLKRVRGYSCKVNKKHTGNTKRSWGRPSKGNGFLKLVDDINTSPEPAQIRKSGKDGSVNPLVQRLITPKFVNEELRVALRDMGLTDG
ncbi:hypothetical protein ACJZ2D_016575 [Fusarium nematophilum]